MNEGNKVFNDPRGQYKVRLAVRISYALNDSEFLHTDGLSYLLTYVQIVGRTSVLTDGKRVYILYNVYYCG